MTLFVSEQVASVVAYNSGNPLFSVYPGENTLQAAASALVAEGFAEDAAASAATAEAVSGPTYASTAAGLAATTSGQAFAVDAGGGLISVYLNSAGTAVFQRTIATTAALANPTGEILEGLAKVERSPSDGLPNESGFWWTTRPQAFGGEVYASTCGDDNDVYLNTYSRPSDGGQQWLRRYFMGHVGNSTVIDDHQGGGVAVRAGKPLVVVWSAHNYDNVLYYRATLKNIDDYLPGEELTFGPVLTHAFAVTSKTSYVIMLPWAGDDTIRFLHRTGDADEWSLCTMADWAAGAITTVPLFTSAGQYYVTGRVNGNTIKCVATGHPSLGVEQTVRYALVDLVSGNVTTTTGTVLGNLDGTNLPLAHASLELVYTSTGTSWPWGFDVTPGPDHSCIFVDGRIPPNFVSTAEYKFARLVGGSWVANDIAAVGSFIGGAYFPSISADPADTNAVYLVRETGGTAYLERSVTANNGTTWTATEIESIPTSETTLCRCYAVEQADANAPIFDLLVTEIDEYPTYNEPWICRVRPSDPVAPVKRLPDIDAATALETPATGLYLPGTSGTYISAPNASLGDLVNGLRIEVDCALADWSSGSMQVLFAKQESTTKRSFYLYVGGDGKVGFAYSTNGTANYTLLSNNLPPTVDHEFIELAALFLPVCNATQLRLTLSYRQPGTRQWIQFDAIQVVPSSANAGAPLAALYDSNSILEVGSRWIGTQDRATGVFRRAGLMTTDGQVVAEWRADARGAGASSVDVAGNVWTLNSPAQSYSSAYNGATRLTLGNYQYFHGPDNEIRFKASAPSSNTDGFTPRSIVGKVSHATNSVGLVREDFVVMDGGASSISYTLPATTSLSSVGLTTKAIEVCCIGSGGATIVPNTSQTINGSTSPITLTQWQLKQVRYLGSGAWLCA